MSDDQPKGAMAPKPTAAPAKSLLHRVRLDPATGIGLFVPGLFVMAIGGAATWHWIFNIGSGVMLAGMAYFVGAIALTALQQRAERKVSAAPAGPVTTSPSTSLPASAGT